MEKIHGSSSHISWDGSQLSFFAGGSSHTEFLKLFDESGLIQLFTENFGATKVVIFGEVYAASVQKMSATYGKQLKFIAFDVKVGDTWLNVPNAEDVVKKLGLEFVSYVRIPTSLDAIDAERDKDSVQAVRNGCGSGHMREGVVLRPIEELVDNRGNRIIVKHKGEKFSECLHTPKVVDGAKLEVMKNAEAIASNWVTPMRLNHVLDKLLEATGMEHTRLVINAMLEDVLREGEAEIEKTPEVCAAISRAAASLWKQHISKI